MACPVTTIISMTISAFSIHRGSFSLSRAVSPMDSALQDKKNLSNGRWNRITMLGTDEQSPKCSQRIQYDDLPLPNLALMSTYTVTTMCKPSPNKLAIKKWNSVTAGGYTSTSTEARRKLGTSNTTHTYFPNFVCGQLRPSNLQFDVSAATSRMNCLVVRDYLPCILWNCWFLKHESTARGLLLLALGPDYMQSVSLLILIRSCCGIIS